MRTGQVIGSTDAIAGEARDQPIHYLDVLATVYRNLGIDPHAMVQDVSGRPAPILPSTAQPIARVV
jgi:arylsulfatase A-like enzyme